MDWLKQLLCMMRENSGPPNKALIRQLYELVLLQCRGQLSPFQYYDYHLCRRSVTNLGSLDYLGRQTYWQIQHKLNHPDWSGIAENKWWFYVHMSSFGLPVPRTYGYYDRINGSTAKGKSLRCAEDLRELLLTIGQPDFVVKPVHGGRGTDVLVLTMQADGSVFESLDGRRLSLQELASFMSAKPFLIQEKVKQHDFMDNLNPYTLNTLRVVTFIDAGGEPRIHWTGMRMGHKGSNTDNVHAGGLPVHVDKYTGILGKGDLDEPFFTAHPDTGVEFTGKQVPFWEDILGLSIRAARVCPLGSVGWDIALSQAGPVLIEVNAQWAYRQPQKCARYMTSEVREHLAEHGINQP